MAGRANDDGGYNGGSVGCALVVAVTAPVALTSEEMMISVGIKRMAITISVQQIARLHRPHRLHPSKDRSDFALHPSGVCISTTGRMTLL